MSHTAGQFWRFGHKDLVLIAPVDDDFILIFSHIISLDERTRGRCAELRAQRLARTGMDSHLEPVHLIAPQTGGSAGTKIRRFLSLHPILMVSFSGCQLRPLLISPVPALITIRSAPPISFMKFASVSIALSGSATSIPLTGSSFLVSFMTFCLNARPGLRKQHRATHEPAWVTWYQRPTSTSQNLS